MKQKFKVLNKYLKRHPTTAQPNLNRMTAQCLCECGKIFECRVDALNSIVSCGCWGIAARRKSLLTHGSSKSAEYQAFLRMKARCENKKDKAYKNYGGRGIKLEKGCQTFAEFLALVGPRPSPQHSIDRIDNDKGYAPGNLRWATTEQQGRNKRTNIFITFQGRTQCVAAWAEEIGMSRQALRKRLSNGWEIEKALSHPIKIKELRS